jgi:hypothetical protein
MQRPTQNRLQRWFTVCGNRSQLRSGKRDQVKIWVRKITGTINKVLVYLRYASNILIIDVLYLIRESATAEPEPHGRA